MFIGIAGIGFYFYSQNMHNYGGRADKMMNASNYPQAITHYKKALLKNPADDAIMMKLANAYLLNKNFDEAAKQLDTVASAKPEKVEALKSTFISTYTAAAKNAEETSNGENAVLYYEKALAITPDDDTIIKSLASLYETQEKSDKAVELYERILKQKPEDMELGQKLATLHQKNGNIEKAIILYNNLATQNKSKAPEFYNTIGKLYLEQNNIQNALEYFKLSSDSGFTEANSGLAKIYLQKGNTEKAFGVLKTMVKSNPDEQTKQAFAETGYKLYSAALISRKTQDASSYLASLKAINPEFLEQKGNELINNGNSFAAQKKYQAALNEYKKAKPLTGESPALIFKMIDMNYKLKNYGEVKHLYSKAVALNKNDAEIQKQLKAMKAAIEKIERAAYIAPVRTQQTSQSIYIPQSHHRPSYIPPRHSAPAYRPQQEPSRPAPVYRPQPRPRKRFNPIQIPKVPSSEVEKGTVIDIPSSK